MRANPKSTSLTPCFVTRMLAGFRIAMCDTVAMGVVQGLADLCGIPQGIVRRERAPQRLAVDQLHDQVIGADVVQRADVGMIQRGDGAGFALEALSETLHRNFDGNVAVQAGIASPVHLAHPALADGPEDFVGAEAGASSESHGKWL